MKPAELQLFDVIPTRECGPLVVCATVFTDTDQGRPDPVVDRVYVDVSSDRPPGWFDPDNLPAATGAEAFQCLGLHPLRYRLAFLPDVEVQAIRG